MKKIFSKKIALFSLIGFILLLIYTISLTIPFVWAIMTSMKTRLAFINSPFLPTSGMNFNNYTKAFDLLYIPVTTATGTKNVYFIRLFINSFVYAIGCGFMHTLAPCLVAYAVAKYRYKFSSFLYGFVIVAMILPSIGTLASEIQLTKAIGIYDTMWGMFIMRFSFLGSNFLIFYATFRSISWEYAEAGLMDGASHFRIFTTIMLPLAKMTFSALFLLSFITFWNEYTTPMIFLPSSPTVAYGLYRFRFSTKNEISAVTMQMAACLLVSAPIFAVFMVARNKLMGNLTMGGLKG